MATTRLRLPFSGAALQELRERAGLTGKGLERACTAAGRRISQQHIARLEDDKSRPRPDTLKALAAGLSLVMDEPVTIDDLLQPKAAE